MTEPVVPEPAPDQAAAERYRQTAAMFSRTVDGVSDWDAPTPVAEWRARDVVGHLTTWLPGLVSGGSSVTFEPIPDAGSDPTAACTGGTSRAPAARTTDSTPSGCMRCSPA